MKNEPVMQEADFWVSKSLQLTCIKLLWEHLANEIFIQIERRTFQFSWDFPAGLFAYSGVSVAPSLLSVFPSKIIKLHFRCKLAKSNSYDTPNL